MSEQLENGQYNVEYNNKNSSTGSFKVNTQKEENRWKVDISNIQYDGYVSNWQVKYKLSANDFWQTSNELTFYVTEQGYYDIKVVHGEEIELEPQKTLIGDLVADNVNKVVNEKKNAELLDENGNKTGRIKERSLVHEDGDIHGTVHIWIRRKTEKGYDLLLQKRSKQKDSFPGCYDISSAGHISAYSGSFSLA